MTENQRRALGALTALGMAGAAIAWVPSVRGPWAAWWRVQGEPVSLVNFFFMMAPIGSMAWLLLMCRRRPAKKAIPEGVSISFSNSVSPITNPDSGAGVHVFSDAVTSDGRPFPDQTLDCTL